MRTLTLLLLACALGSAQVSTGTFNLEVKDATGAVMPAVALNLQHAATGATREGVTNERGVFRASFMPIGEYVITATMQGFKRQTLRGLSLQVDQDANVTITMQPGEVRETVEVTGAMPLLESSTSAIGQVIENKKIMELPLNGRNPFALGLLAGNTTPMFGMGSNLPFVGGGGRFSSNEVMLDGVDNNTIQNAGAVGRSGIAYTPSVDAVQEFKVKTNNFSAEFGHSAGTVVAATIKSGSNEFHGSLFEFLRNDKLDANNFFTNSAGQPKGKFRQNQFGAAVGGRVLRDRTFWFADFEATRIKQQSSNSILDVPIADFRNGNFARLLPNTVIYDPGARLVGPAGTVISTPFPNNQIPQNRINSTSTAITNLVPLPNYGVAGDLARNYFRQRPNEFRGDRGDLRIDHKLTNNNSLYARYSLWNQRQPIPGAFEGFIGGGAKRIDFSRHAVLGDTHIFSPRVVNEFRFGFVRHNGSDVGDGPGGVAFANANRLALFPFPDLGFPSISFNFSGAASGSQQFSSWGGGASNYNIENTFQWSDNINVTRGNHTLKFGGDLRRYRYEVLKGSPFYGNIIFGSILSSSSDRSGSGAPLADFLMGFPAFYEGTQMLDWGRHRTIYAGFYFQDDWKVSRRLTLNLGLRYDLYTQPIDTRNNGSLFNVKTGRFQLPGVDGFSRAIVDGDHNNIGPRFGFAYQWSQKLVIRGGYGLFYGLRDQNQETTQFSGNNPNVPTLTFPVVSAQNTVAAPFTLNTIVAAPSDTTLASFSAARPFVRTIRTQIFDGARYPLLHQANVSFQWEPRANWLLETTLSTSRGRDLATSFLHSNQVPFSYALDGRATQANRPFPHVNGTVPTVDSTGTSSYHAVNFKVEKRYSSGLSFLLNYTIQKNMETNGTGPSAFTQNGGTSFVFDQYNLSRERAVAPIDVPQIFVASYGYEIPFMKRNKLLGGWQVNGITTVRGGFPSDLRTNVLAPIFNTFNMPDVVAGKQAQVQSGRNVDNFFDPTAFKVPGTTRSNSGATIQLLGDSARRNVRGPGSVNLDLSAFKNTRIKERYSLQFRAEFFNLTNTPTFFLPSASSNNMTCIGPAGGACNAGNAQFGKISNGTATGRQIQFGLKFLF